MTVLLPPRRKTCGSYGVLVVLRGPWHWVSHPSCIDSFLFHMCVRSPRFGPATPEHVRNERNEDAKGERTDYNPSYGRRVDTGVVRFGRCNGGRRRSDNSFIRVLGYCSSTQYQYGYIVEDRGRYARGRRLDRKITTAREEDTIWIEVLKKIKLVFHAPRSKDSELHYRIKGPRRTRCQW